MSDCHCHPDDELSFSAASIYVRSLLSGEGTANTWQGPEARSNSQLATYVRAMFPPHVSIRQHRAVGHFDAP